MPAMVLSGNAAEGARLAATLPNGRGWLRKDASADDLRAAIERALHRGGTVRAARLGRPVMLAAAALIIGLLALAVLVFRG